MFRFHCRSWGLIAAVLAVSFDASSASAQFFPGNNPYFRATGGVNAGMPAAAMIAQPAIAPVAPLLPGGGNLVTNPYSSLLPNPGMPFVPPYMPFYFDPGAYLRGSADVINAQGRYLIDRQDALMKRESVKQMKLETRRKIFDEWLYERERTPRPEELRQQGMREQLTRSLNNPPANEITAGISLNSILASLESMTVGKNVKVADVPVDEELLKKINVTKGTGTGNAGVLRNEGKLSWPRSLEALAPVEKTTDLRTKIEFRTRAAYEQAASGKVDNDLIKELQTLTGELNGILTRSINSMGFQEYTEAKKFMKNLDDSIGVLSRGDARDFLDGANIAKGKTVQDLVQNMSAKGLRFAPAVGDNQAAYIALHRAMVQYYNALTAEMNRVEK